MKLTYEKVMDVGTENERVCFVASEDCDIGKYIVFTSKYMAKDSKTISSRVDCPFWFPDKIVRRNDHVVLYTKTGSPTEKTNSDGTISYFFYRGLPDAHLKDDAACVVIMDASLWRSYLAVPAALVSGGRE